MPRKFAITNTRPLSEINLTPLMDLTFVLLITFIITFPLIEQGIPVKLPQADTAPLPPPTEARSVTIGADGAVHLDDVAIAIGELEAELRRLKDMDPDLMVMVRADEDLRYKRVVEVLKALHDARITRMTLVTQATE